MKITAQHTYLKCVKAIPACPKLEVGDLVWQVTREIWDGGYEYAVAHRRGDGEVLRFRVEHLEDCFEEVVVDDEYIF